MYFESFCINKHKWQQRDWNPQPFRKRTLNYLAKLAEWLSCVVSTYLYGVDESLQSINWVARAAQGSSRLTKLTQKQDLVKLVE